MAQQQQQAAPGVVEKVISLVQQITTRDGSLLKDSKMVNCYPEQTENGPGVVKRPGLVTLGTSPNPGVGQGMCYTGSAGLVCFIAGQCYYVNNPLTLNAGGITGGAAPNATEPFYNLDSFTLGLGFLGAVIKQGGGLWLGSVGGIGNTVQFSRTTDANYPATTVPGIAILDYTTYVMDLFGNIRGSALNNANSWPVTNSIAVDSGLGGSKALHRHPNYIIAFCDKGLQFFYDAGNPTGSPLSIVPNGSFRIGCVAGFGVCELDDVTYFISKSATNRGRSVSSINGFQIVEISNPYINRILDSISIPTDPIFVFIRMYGMKIGGHSFLIINLTQANITLAYDTVYQHWHLWTSTVGGVEQAFVGGAVSNIGLLTNLDSIAAIQDYTTGSLYTPSQTAYTDVTGVIPVLIRTKPYDWGTLRRKFFEGLYLLADTVAATVAVSYSDDDYQTFSAARNVDLSTAKKMLTRLGSSRRRSWDIRHTANTPLKLYGAEVPFEVGN